MKPDNKLQISSFLPDKKESFINCLQYGILLIIMMLIRIDFFLKFGFSVKAC